MNLADLQPLTPMLTVLAASCLLLMLEVFSEKTNREWAAYLTVAALAFAGCMSIALIAEDPRPLFAASGPGHLVSDGFGHMASTVMIVATAIAALLSPAYLSKTDGPGAEYYALMLMSLAGMMVMAMAADLITLFLGLEVMSIAVYVLTGLRRGSVRSSEAALKYFLMGAFATAFLLYGIALVYGQIGGVHFTEISAKLQTGPTPTVLTLGLFLVLIGLAFKVAAVPFHVWAPDVYEGAPTPVTGYMAVGVKAAAFVGLLRIALTAFGPAFVPLAVPLLTALACLTIIGGNLLAVVQTNIKRMLAYSSVAHAGYALVGLIAAVKGEATAGPALLFYLSAYTFMTLGAFGVLTALERRDGVAAGERYGAFAGVGFRHPALSLAMALFMIALAGIPLTGGFVGKLYIFGAAVRAGELPLVFVGVGGSIISIYYYLRVIVAFYMRDVADAGPTPEPSSSPALTAGLALSAAGILCLGLFPTWWLDLGREAMRAVALL